MAYDPFCKSISKSIYFQLLRYEDPPISWVEARSPGVPKTCFNSSPVASEVRRFITNQRFRKEKRVRNLLRVTDARF